MLFKKGEWTLTRIARGYDSSLQNLSGNGAHFQSPLLC